MDTLQQPGFQQLTQHLTGAANQISLVPNLPAVNEGQAILAQLGHITQQLASQGQQITTVLSAVNTLRADVTTLKADVITLKADVNTLKADVSMVRDDIARIDTRLNASETNILARLYNSNVVKHSEVSFLPLHNRRDRPVNGFPENGRALARLTGDELLALLQGYDQRTDDNLTVKRKRFRQFIGLMAEV